MEITSLDDLKRSVLLSLHGYRNHLMEDARDCEEEGLVDYVKQRGDQLKEFTPVMLEICSLLGSLSYFKE